MASKSRTIFLENLREAFISVRNNKVRASLTILIIALGITAIVGTLTAISGLEASLLNDVFSGSGANTLRISDRSFSFQRGRNQERIPDITWRQSIAFKDAMANKHGLQVSVSDWGTGAAEARFEGRKTNPNVFVRGIDENYNLTAGYVLEDGRDITALDVQNVKNVAVIGHEIRERLFPDRSAVGNTIFVRDNVYLVIGVYESKSSSFGSGDDNIVAIPVTTMRKDYMRNSRSFNIAVFAPNAAQIDQVESISTGEFRLARGLRPAEKNNFSIEKADSVLDLIRENLAVMTLIATSVAIITLIGAAIGLMNIMLVSVTERTREIGVRKSMGASSKVILQQFLTEAITITQLGGLLGVFMGILIGNIFAFVLDFVFVIPWGWILLAFTICLIVGLTSGIMPARKAARVDPIQSLRYE